MAIMKSRSMNGMSGYKYQQVPAVMLKGKWLEQLNFHIGDYVSVSCEDGKIIITPDVEKAFMKEAEAAFMEKEIVSLKKRFENEKEKIRAQFVAEQEARYGV